MDPQVEYVSRIDFTELREGVEKVKSEIGKVIVGQQQVIEMMIAAILANGHVLLEGVPGVAKTLMANLLARTIKADFTRIQFTPDLMPSDVIGTAVFHPEKAQFEFRKGPVFSNIILIDEINRSPAKTQAALFEVMEEHQISYDGVTYKMREPFFVIATQNPIEQEGTYRLPEAQLDRFLFKLMVNYPTLQEEVEIINGHHTRTADTKPVDLIEGVLDGEKIANFRRKIKEVHVEPKLIDYIANLITQTRNAKSIFLGASPRASVAVLNTSKALAAMRGRDFITPEDIREVLPNILRHRLILTPEKEMEGASTDDIIKLLMQKVEVPR
ncbi:MAG: MoxR family ATPase [Bacteroidia bacterium]